LEKPSRRGVTHAVVVKFIANLSEIVIAMTARAQLAKSEEIQSNID
jgi:hypothetical protein